MCRYRQVQNTYLQCNHTIREPDVMIYCADRFCKFSASHPADCGSRCRDTCWQRRQFPEQYMPQINSLCPNCRHAAALAAAEAQQQARNNRR